MEEKKKVSFSSLPSFTFCPILPPLYSLCPGDLAFGAFVSHQEFVKYSHPTRALPVLKEKTLSGPFCFPVKELVPLRGLSL